MEKDKNSRGFIDSLTDFLSDPTGLSQEDITAELQEVGIDTSELEKKVMVLEFFPRLLPRQLDLDGARRLQSILEGMGFAFRLGAKTEEITGADQVKGVQLEGGEELPAEMVMGRIGQTRGVLNSLAFVPEIKKEIDKVLKINPEHTGALDAKAMTALPGPSPLGWVPVVLPAVPPSSNGGHCDAVPHGNPGRWKGVCHSD